MGRGEAYTEFWWGNLRERGHLGNPGIDRWIFRKLDVGVWTRMELVQDRNRWRVLMNAGMNHRVP
jgi:hypothetical protein